jgi:hypothetical protein
MLMAARSLGLDEKFDIVFRVLQEVAENSINAVNFEEFLKALTAKIVIYKIKFREILSASKEEALTSVCMICKVEENSLSMS